MPISFGKKKRKHANILFQRKHANIHTMDDIFYELILDLICIDVNRYRMVVLISIFTSVV